MREICIVVFDGLQILDLTGPVSVFANANLHRRGSYRVQVASPQGGDVRSNSSVVIGQTISLRRLQGPFDTVVVAGGDEEALTAAIQQSRVHLWLRNVEARRIASVCTGAFLLAAAGLLDGRRAATHWSACARLSELFPNTRVDADAIFVRDGKIWSSAGVTTGIDLALALVEADLGREIAAAVARELVLFLRRPGGQSQYSASLRAQQGSTGSLSDLITWIAEHPRSNLDVSTLAERVAMSERNFARVFLRETRRTPAAFVADVRTDCARALLESTTWPLPRVAERSGFRSIAAFLRTFRSRVGTNPTEYRERFGTRKPSRGTEAP